MSSSYPGDRAAKPGYHAQSQQHRDFRRATPATPSWASGQDRTPSPHVATAAAAAAKAAAAASSAAIAAAAAAASVGNRSRSRQPRRYTPSGCAPAAAQQSVYPSTSVSASRLQQPSSYPSQLRASLLKHDVQHHGTVSLHDFHKVNPCCGVVDGCEFGCGRGVEWAWVWAEHVGVGCSHGLFAWGGRCGGSAPHTIQHPVQYHPAHHPVPRIRVARRWCRR